MIRKRWMIVIGCVFSLMAVFFMKKTCNAWGVTIDEKNFPDEVFRKYVSEHFDLDGDGVFRDDERAAVTRIDVSNMDIKEISLEFFKDELKYLDCSGCKLTYLSISSYFNKLEYVNCSNNQITQISSWFYGNKGLKYLDCSNNQLSDGGLLPKDFLNLENLYWIFLRIQILILMIYA